MRLAIRAADEDQETETSQEENAPRTESQDGLMTIFGSPRSIEGGSGKPLELSTLFLTLEIDR